MTMLTPEIVGLVHCTCGLWRRCAKECQLPSPPEYYKEALETTEKLRAKSLTPTTGLRVLP